MPDVADMTPGEVLTEASVAEFIKALGLSIAQAQKALDENSVDQIGEFIRPREGLDGRSLLDLGLSPAFYHYQHADVSCSMQLSLRVERNLSVGVNLSGSFNDTTTENNQSANTETTTESGSTAVTRERSAQIEVQSASTGALSIGGQTFNVSGADPLARIRALQQAVTTNEAAGVPRLLYEHPERSFTITTDAEAGKVQTTDRTVAFIGGGFDRAIIRISENVATAYKLSDTDTANTTPQGDVAAYAVHSKAQVEARGYAVQHIEAGEDFIMARFKTGRHDLEVFTLGETTYNASSRSSLMHMARHASTTGLSLEVKGFADAQPYRGQNRADSDTSNRELGMRRAEEIKRILVSNGMDPAKVTTTTDGSAAAQANVATGGPVDNVDFRRTTVKFLDGNHYLFVNAPDNVKTIGNIEPDKRAAGATGNGFVYLYNPVALALTDKKCGIDGTDFPFRGGSAGGHAAGAPEAYAVNLRDAINGTAAVDFQASAEGNVVTVFGKSSPFKLTLYTAETRSLQITASEGISITREFSRTTSSNLTRQNTGNRTVAVGATLDVRFGRQFEMNVTGNSAISARLVSIPAPPQFLETIKAYLAKEN